MIYTVWFNPTKADYKIKQKLGSALDRSRYPVVSKSGFRSYQEAEQYIDSQCYPSFGQPRASYEIRAGAQPDPDRTWNDD